MSDPKSELPSDQEDGALKPKRPDDQPAPPSKPTGSTREEEDPSEQPS
jgi:hypothetical protein